MLGRGHRLGALRCYFWGKGLLWARTLGCMCSTRCTVTAMGLITAAAVAVGGAATTATRPLTATTTPLCDIPSGCCSFTGPWTFIRSSLRMLHRVFAFCRPLRPVLLLVSFPRSRSPIVGILRMCWLLPGSFDCFGCPRTSVHRPSMAWLTVSLCVCEAQVPCSSTRCPGRPPYVLFPLTAGLPLMGSRSCGANNPSGLRETPPPLMPVEQGLP